MSIVQLLEKISAFYAERENIILIYIYRAENKLTLSIVLIYNDKKMYNF